MSHLSRPDGEHTDLTTGFRVPDIIIELANRLLPHLGVSVSPARSVRSDGSVSVIASDELVNATLDAVDKALVDEGVIGVIATDPILETLRPCLPAIDRLELVPAALAKGLEFDHVIVVEPAEFRADAGRGSAERPDGGLRHLYVALTRAVSRLTVVHTQPIPDELGLLPSR